MRSKTMMTVPFKVDLKGKVCAITGGGGVLGKYWVEALAESGAKVAILDRNLSHAEEMASELKANGYSVIGVQADVVSKESLKKAHEAINEKFGPVDILINGAGGNHTKEALQENIFMKRTSPAKTRN